MNTALWGWLGCGVVMLLSSSVLGRSILIQIGRVLLVLGIMSIGATAVQGERYVILNEVADWTQLNYCNVGNLLVIFGGGLLTVVWLFNKVKGGNMLRKLWQDETGQDIAEYAVMLAVILVIVVGTIRLIGSNANNVFNSVASSIH